MISPALSKAELVELATEAGLQIFGDDTERAIIIAGPNGEHVFHGVSLSHAASFVLGVLCGQGKFPPEPQPSVDALLIKEELN